MSRDSDSEVFIRVDPTNPGQFFACCGLLEISERLFQRGEGAFRTDGFSLTTPATLAVLLHSLVWEEPREETDLGSGVTVKPLIAPLQLSLAPGAREMRLDWWVKVRIEKGTASATPNSPWNFWSGQQTSLRIWKGLRSALSRQLEDDSELATESLFDHRVPLSGRFGFDPGASWNSLGVGFSPNEQKIEVASSPALELLAAVGLQRFRPAISRDRATFIYATWRDSLAPPVAAAAASGLLAIPCTTRFRGCVVSRGSYAALGNSTLLKGPAND